MKLFKFISDPSFCLGSGLLRIDDNASFSPIKLVFVSCKYKKTQNANLNVFYGIKEASKIY